MKTTLLGALTILVALCNAAIALIKGTAIDFAATATAVTAGYGLIRAADQ